MRIFFIISCLLSVSFTTADSIYNYSFTSIEGIQVNLSSYKEKKIVLVTLPVAANSGNSLYLKRLDSLSRIHEGGLVMIGVPSYEDGYTSEGNNNLKDWYRSILGNQFLISKGMRTRKSSSQDALFKWLTNEDLNKHFDLDIDGPGQQFFISGSGNLYAVIGSEAKSNNKIFNKLIQ